MGRKRRVKIVATLGPACADSAMVGRLYEAGADVFRINMSHSDHDTMRARIRMIRALEKEYNRPIGILVDLQGPKLRIGAFAAGSVAIEKGAHFILDADTTPGDAHRVHLPHPEILRALLPGHTLLIDDGRVRLRVLEASPHRALTVVEIAGVVSNRKGVSLPDTVLPVSAMTAKDRSDLDAALADCREVLRLVPDDPYAHDNIGLIYLKRKQWDRAIEQYSASLRIDPDRARALYGRGLARTRNGQGPAGINDMSTASGIQPNIAGEFKKYGVN